MKHHHRRWIRRLAGWGLALALGGMIGYRSRDYRVLAATRAGTLSSWTLDDFVRPRSFSPVEATRAELEGLAQLYRTEARTRLLHAETPTLPAVARRSETIAELERGWEAFRDTPGEPFVAQDLLLLLKKAGDHARWVEVYLDIVYRRPTDELIGLFAQDALDLGTAVGRASDISAALRHVLEIPMEFPAKHRIALPVAASEGFGSHESVRSLL